MPRSPTRAAGRLLALVALACVAHSAAAVPPPAEAFGEVPKIAAVEISPSGKLVAWGESREASIARMARALVEYQVLGIRTTIPFFVWLMRQPDYRDGRYDTTWLDRLMADRRGATFNELDDNDRQLVTIAAAIDAYRRARASAGTGGDAGSAAPSTWQRIGRIEALRS